jgi:hypothetical protein
MRRVPCCAMDLSEFVDRTADERLIAGEADNLPASVGRPEPLPEPSPARKRIVAIGATMTGATLLIGIALIAAGIGEAVSNGVALAIAALAVGVALLGTHWGWVHVAEMTGNAIENRRNSAVLDRRRSWLAQIKPYTRYEVTTNVDEEGSVRIMRLRYEPVATGEGRFTFSRATELEESYCAEEPGATVTERAELLRRQAAADTERERERFELAADAYQTALMSAGDEHERRAARRAASEALSEQINANLRDPPLVE